MKYTKYLFSLIASLLTAVCLKNLFDIPQVAVIGSACGVAVVSIILMILSDLNCKKADADSVQSLDAQIDSIKDLVDSNGHSLTEAVSALTEQEKKQFSDYIEYFDNVADKTNDLITELCGSNAETLKIVSSVKECAEKINSQNIGFSENFSAIESKLDGVIDKLENNSTDINKNTEVINGSFVTVKEKLDIIGDVAEKIDALTSEISNTVKIVADSNAKTNEQNADANARLDEITDNISDFVSEYSEKSSDQKESVDKSFEDVSRVLNLIAGSSEKIKGDVSNTGNEVANIKERIISLDNTVKADSEKFKSVPHCVSYIAENSENISGKTDDINEKLDIIGDVAEKIDALTSEISDTVKIVADSNAKTNEQNAGANARLDEITDNISDFISEYSEKSSEQKESVDKSFEDVSRVLNAIAGSSEKIKGDVSNTGNEVANIKERIISLDNTVKADSEKFKSVPHCVSYIAENSENISGKTDDINEKLDNISEMLEKVEDISNNTIDTYNSINELGNKITESSEDQGKELNRVCNEIRKAYSDIDSMIVKLRDLTATFNKEASALVTQMSDFYVALNTASRK